jgi:hypothetical protein
MRLRRQGETCTTDLNQRQAGLRVCTCTYRVRATTHAQGRCWRETSKATASGIETRKRARARTQVKIPQRKGGHRRHTLLAAVLRCPVIPKPLPAGVDLLLPSAYISPPGASRHGTACSDIPRAAPQLAYPLCSSISKFTKLASYTTVPRESRSSRLGLVESRSIERHGD